VLVRAWRAGLAAGPHQGGHGTAERTRRWPSPYYANLLYQITRRSRRTRSSWRCCRPVPTRPGRSIRTFPRSAGRLERGLLADLAAAAGQPGEGGEAGGEEEEAPKRPKWENDPRITRVCKWIRRTSMDELPQIINIVRGDMSNRRAASTHAEQKSHTTNPGIASALNTLPGLTSLWQVSGRSKVPFEEQCLLDI